MRCLQKDSEKGSSFFKIIAQMFGIQISFRTFAVPKQQPKRILYLL
jgi:hypothetical protein